MLRLTLSNKHQLQVAQTNVVTKIKKKKDDGEIEEVADFYSLENLR